MGIEHFLILITVFIICMCIAAVIITMKEYELKYQKGRYEDLREQWKNHVETTNKTKQKLWEEIEEISAENDRMKKIIEKYEKDNVPRETGYNKSYGTPEVIDWINQQYAGEDVNRG